MGREERLCRQRAVGAALTSVTAYLALFLHDLTSSKPSNLKSHRYAGAFWGKEECLEAESRKTIRVAINSRIGRRNKKKDFVVSTAGAVVDNASIRLVDSYGSMAEREVTVASHILSNIILEDSDGITFLLGVR